MNYGISILFRAIPLAMAAFCFAYGAYVFAAGDDPSRLTAGPVLFFLGSISLYERAPGAEATEVDGGFISAPTDVDDVYYAVSTTYQDVTYEFTLFDTDSIVWGGENDYYERLE